jgi:hypothetical protein
MVLNLYIENFTKLSLQDLGFDWGHYLYPGLKITLHDIGRSDIILLFPIILKIINSTMLKETPDNGYYPDIVGKPFNSRSQPAGVANNEIHMNTGL